MALRPEAIANWTVTAPTDDEAPFTKRTLLVDFASLVGYGRLRKSFIYRPDDAVDIASGRTTAFSYETVVGIGEVKFSKPTVKS